MAVSTAVTSTLRRPSPAWRGRYASLWLAVLTIGFLGVIATGFGFRLVGSWADALATILLGAVAIRRVHAFRRAASALPSLVGLVLLTVGLLVTIRPDASLRDMIPARLFASQLLLLGLTIEDIRPRTDWARATVPAAGHVAVTVAAVVITGTSGPLPVSALMLAMVGFALLLLEAFWAHRQSSRGRGLAAWESGFLLVLSAFLAGAGALAFLEGRFGGTGRVADLSLASIQASVLFGVAVLSGPPGPPSKRYMHRSGSFAELLSSAGVFIVLVYALLFALALSAQWIATPVFWALVGWLSLSVLLEYVVTVHGLRRPRLEELPPEGEIEPLTVVIAARNEADVLKKSIRENLALDAPLSFLLVPASSSTDDTVQVAKGLQDEHPDRVRVEVGTGGSKAADLNQAWPHVETDLVVILDADETLDEASLRQGLARLEDDPDIGVVQGRKKGRGEPQGWLDRFIRAERRYSTLLDHPFQNDVFDAAHFAGAGALLRREVPASVGGWDPMMLTEDIDFSLRLSRGSRWRIAYDPGFVVWETNPRDAASFLRQRGRWSRGWAQVAARHLPSIVTGPASLSPGQRLGWGWQTLTAVSAPWSLFLPFIAFLWLIGQAPAIAPSLAFLLTLWVLPSRGIAYLYAYYRDPVGQEERTLRGGLSVLVLAYLWILVGWLLQLHALYLEVSASPTVWQPTRATSAEDPEG